MATSEFRHYDGCKHHDIDNCQACALTDTRQDAPNYTAWPLAYMDNNRAIPAKWREAFKRELASENIAYALNLRIHMMRHGVRFDDGKGLED